MDYSQLNIQIGNKFFALFDIVPEKPHWGGSIKYVRK